MLSAEWSRAMGFNAPILNAPMGGVAGGALAAAVSRAGGLGMVGIGSAGCALVLDEQLGHLRESGRRFGIGLVAWVIASEPQLLTAAIAAKPALLSVGFGEDFSWVRRAQCLSSPNRADARMRPRGRTRAARSGSGERTPRTVRGRGCTTCAVRWTERCPYTIRPGVRGLCSHRGGQMRSTRTRVPSSGSAGS